MKKYALLIGNSKFPDEPNKKSLPNLNCPEQDVDGLAAVLGSENGEFSVVSLKNQPSSKILSALEDVVNEAQKNDLLLLYYSGHGKCNGAGILHLTTLDTLVNKLGSQAISIQRVYDILAIGSCKNVIIILDCCFSGAAGQGFKGTFDDQLQQLNNSRGTYLVTSSSKEQLSKDGAVGGYSLFTSHLITGLETGDADKDGDGWISMNELYDYVHAKVTAEYPNQQPTKHVKDERGGLIIAKSGRDSRKERYEKIRLLLLKFEEKDAGIDEIKSEILTVARMPNSQLSTTQLKKDELLTELLTQKITLFSFIRAWDKQEGNLPKQKKWMKYWVWVLIITIVSMMSAYVLLTQDLNNTFESSTIKQENAAAQNNLGATFQKGESVKNDDVQAVELYRKAAEQGYPDAQNNLGFMYLNGKGVQQSYTQAFEWYRKAAEQGYALAQTNLGSLYENGKGVTQDNIQAFELYRKSAEQGSAVGQSSLGVVYYNGTGVKKDYAQALKWFHKAAEQGDAKAQFNLGVMCEKGEGVKQDDKQAVEWYRKSAEQGYPDAQNRLAFMIQKRKGVE